MQSVLRPFWRVPLPSRRVKLLLSVKFYKAAKWSSQCELPYRPWKLYLQEFFWQNLAKQQNIYPLKILGYNMVQYTFSSSCGVRAGKQLQKCLSSSAMAAWCRNSMDCCSSEREAPSPWTHPLDVISWPPGTRLAIADCATRGSTVCTVLGRVEENSSQYTRTDECYSIRLPCKGTVHFSNKFLTSYIHSMKHLALFGALEVLFLILVSSSGFPIFSTHSRKDHVRWKDRGAWGQGYLILQWCESWRGQTSVHLVLHESYQLLSVPGCHLLSQWADAGTG